MTQHKSQQRRGLGRGLGSLIPTAPRPDTPHDGEPAAGGTTTTTTVGSADWIGVPLPGDETAAHEPTTSALDDVSVFDPTSSAASERPGAADDDSPAETPEDGEGGEGGQDAPTDHAAGEASDTAVTESDEPEAGPELRAVEGAYFAELPVEAIRPNPRQPREVFDEDAMAELVHSVQEVGLLQPIVVRPTGGGTFELVMGERRWRATQQAGLDVIPAIVRETGDDDLLRDALLENLHRAELNALEEAAAYQQLLEDFGCTHDELAARIGRSRPQISNTIRLLRLSPAVQRRVAAGVLSAGHARALLAVEDAATQDRLAGRVVAEGISVRGLEEIVSVGDLGAERAAPGRRNRPTAPGVEDLAARLSDRLETRVRVDLGKRKGRITVEFASLPDLERIVAMIDPDHPTRTHRDPISS